MVKNASVPYECERCHRGECKLWRTALTYTTHLLCIEDLALVSRVPVDALIEAVECRHVADAGWWFPAIPHESRLISNFSFWGYSLAPEEEMDWWYHLPTVPEEKQEAAI